MGIFLTDLRGRLRNARSELHETSLRAEALVSLVEEARADVDELRSTIDRLNVALSEISQIRETAEANHVRTMQALRVVRDDDSRARAALLEARATDEYEAAFDEAEPLVSVLISTYSNFQLLAERSIPSILGQTYENWEVIVVGDAAPDEARRVVESFGDKRISFVNLPYRGPYPEKKHDAWLVSGTMPWNTGLSLARGRWIATNGDDDALRPKHLEKLLAHARVNRAEVPYGYINFVEPGGRVKRLGTSPPQASHWQLQASLLHSSLRFLAMQPSDWMFGVPNDVSLLERMLRIGVRFSLMEEEVVDYYPSALWSGEEGRPAYDQSTTHLAVSSPNWQSAPEETDDGAT